MTCIWIALSAASVAGILGFLLAAALRAADD